MRFNIPVPAGGDSKEGYKALEFDVDGIAPNITSGSFAVSIVIDKGGNNNTGSIDVPEDVANGTKNYRAFKIPATVQVAPINFSTINLRGAFGLSRPFKKDGTENTSMQPAGDEAYVGWSYATKDYTPASPKSPGPNLISSEINFDSDIYFIYALSDEMTPSTVIAPADVH